MLFFLTQLQSNYVQLAHGSCANKPHTPALSTGRQTEYPRVSSCLCKWKFLSSKAKNSTRENAEKMSKEAVCVRHAAVSALISFTVKLTLHEIIQFSEFCNFNSMLETIMGKDIP